MSLKNNKQPQDPNEKVELAKRIANQSKRVSHSYASVEAALFRVVRFFSSLVDRLIFSRKYLGLVSLALTFLLYFVVNFNDNNFITPQLSSSKTLNNVTVTARYNDESFELSDLPTSCQVVLTGDGANVSAAATKQGYCMVDLEGYAEGTHSVPLVATGYGNNVNLIVTPSETVVTLKKKTTAQFTLEYDFMNRNQMDSRYILGEPKFAGDKTKVNIRASQDTLNSIAMVKALIDVSGQSSDFTVVAPLAAYDRNGQVVKADIDPNSVEVSVGVTSPRKTVPIKLIMSGEAPSGLAISSVQMDHQTTEIFAPEKVLAEINEVTVKLDASTLISNSEIIQPIILPPGVSSSEISNVTLKVVLQPTVRKQMNDIPIHYRNNTNGYGATGVDNPYVSVTLIGTQENIDKVKAEDIIVYIDVAGLTPGTYDLPLQAEVEDNSFVKVSVSRSQIHLTLTATE